MKKLSLLLILSIFFSNIFAFYKYQDQEKREEIQKLKIAFLTDELDLSVEEAQVFWPIYNEYETKKHELYRDHKSACRESNKNLEEMSDSEIDALVNGKIEFEQEKLALKTDFHESLKEIFDNKKIAKFYIAEKQFKKQLFNEMRDRADKCNGKSY